MASYQKARSVSLVQRSVNSSSKTSPGIWVQQGTRYCASFHSISVHYYSLFKTWWDASSDTSLAFHMFTLHMFTFLAFSLGLKQSVTHQLQNVCNMATHPTVLVQLMLLCCIKFACLLPGKKAVHVSTLLGMQKEEGECWVCFSDKMLWNACSSPQFWLSDIFTIRLSLLLEEHLEVTEAGFMDALILCCYWPCLVTL